MGIRESKLVLGKPFDISKIGRYAKLLQAKRAKAAGIDLEWGAILQAAMEEGSSDFVRETDHLRPRNRYRDILPFEATRVHLKEPLIPATLSTEADDYINANWIDGLVRQAYIASQGPLEETAPHFWQMVWEQDVRVIVMLTRLVESEVRVKCFQYWPEIEEELQYGQFMISMLDESLVDGNEFVVLRKFSVSRAAEGGAAPETKEVVQFQYSEWPDHGVPPSSETFRNLLKAVDRANGTLEAYSVAVDHVMKQIERGIPMGALDPANVIPEIEEPPEESPQPAEKEEPKPYDLDGSSDSVDSDDRQDLTPPKPKSYVRSELPEAPGPPLLVHCSAGIGRTGTFCAVHICSHFMRIAHEQSQRDKISREPQLHMISAVLQLRKQRVGMVQTKAQYSFCYEAVGRIYEELTGTKVFPKRVQLIKRPKVRKGKGKAGKAPKLVVTTKSPKSTKKSGNNSAIYESYVVIKDEGLAQRQSAAEVPKLQQPGSKSGSPTSSKETSPAKDKIIASLAHSSFSQSDMSGIVLRECHSDLGSSTEVTNSLALPKGDRRPSTSRPASEGTSSITEEDEEEDDSVDSD